MNFDRQNKNIFTSWWWTVDRLSLFVTFMIVAFGAIMVTTASPAIAERIGLDSFYFVKRQLVFLFLSIIILLFTSFLSPLTIRRGASIGFAFGILMLLIVLIFGTETNGAKRWISLFGFSLQPSEFMKPFFIIVTAWMLSESKVRKDFNGGTISLVLYILLASLLIMQPDFGMFFVVTIVWGGQLFISGLSMIKISLIVTGTIITLLLAYLFFPHVTYRIDSFINSDNNVSYQVGKSLDAFSNGGLLGKGPGEGVVKQSLPDSHTDFIFAVVGEELGALLCIFLVICYGFIVVRGLKRMLEETDLFLVYAASGLLMQFGIQATINMGVATNLLPTKGMTLPFISYGGSSMLAIAISMGMILALTKRRFGHKNSMNLNGNINL